MNRIGHEGSGESVWLGWFLSKALRDFAPIASGRGDSKRAEHWLAQAHQVTRSIEAHGWDGAWYRRAYFDDGTPIGTHSATECRIDAIAQSWATIAGGGDPARAARALRESERMLLDRNTNTMLLLTPPFAHSQPDPGYISSYPAGVRENGGQYTHGVLFTLRALAQSGDRERTARLLDALNPILHGDNPERMERYKVEPYVVAADVYASPSHMGRGGWTWYTGAAGWFYRVVLEDVLGVQRHGDYLTFNPCVPPGWNEFELTYRYGSSNFHIVVDTSRPSGELRLLMDGNLLDALVVPLQDDGRTHEVRLEMGEHKLRTSA
jgi:cyclic beta-1,2-glucan synthetase